MVKKAFTLAEVLITLGIIGVIAAMTLPSVINRTRQKELETAFNKQYSVLQQAVMKVKYEDELPFDTASYGISAITNDSESNFMNSLARQYNVLKNCGSINKNTGCILQEDDGTFSYYKTLSNSSLDRLYIDDGGFITTDGTTFFIEQGKQAETTGFLVSIDLNGYLKKPNRMGYDLFMFSITKEGKVQPMGAEGTYWQNSREQLCSKTSTSSQNGYTCAYYALTDKDYFKNLH